MPSVIFRALDLAQAFGEDFFATAASAMRAEIHFCNGKLDAAIDVLTRMLESKDTAWKHKFRSVALSNRASYKIAAGDVDGAYADAAEVLSDAHEFDPAYVSFLSARLMFSIQALAAVAALRGQPARAAQLLGKVDALLASATYARGKTERFIHELLLTSLREQLGENARATYMAWGADLSVAAAIEMAMVDAETSSCELEAPRTCRNP